MPTETEKAIIPVVSTNYPTSGSAVDINSVTMANGSSLISTSTFFGNITYTRNLATTNWYLVSSPVVGQTYNDAYVTANGIDSGTGSNRGIAPYVTGDDSWDYMQAGETTSFSTGTGYSVKRLSLIHI